MPTKIIAMRYETGSDNQSRRPEDGEPTEYVVLTLSEVFQQLEMALRFFEAARRDVYRCGAVLTKDSIPADVESYLSAVTAIHDALMEEGPKNYFGFQLPEPATNLDVAISIDGVNIRPILAYQSRSGDSLLLLVEEGLGFRFIYAYNKDRCMDDMVDMFNSVEKQCSMYIPESIVRAVELKRLLALSRR